MKNLLKAVLTLALVFGFALGAQAQQGQGQITQTTLVNAVLGPAGYSGTSSTISTSVTLAACTGVLAPILPGTPVSDIYIDREVMGVLTWNTSTCSGTVLRGYLGTQAAPHSAGTMVLMAVTYQTNLAQGGNPLPNGFFNQDPPVGATCSAGVPTNVWVNVLTGNQWLCSTITNTWVPGFTNSIGETIVPTTAVASATTILPSGPLFHLTGTTSITTITDPVGCNATAVGGCQFTVICDAVCTWAASGNIAVAAGTVVAGTPVTFIWDAKNSKWVPTTTT
jgi:hypothetical protein